MTTRRQTNPFRSEMDDIETQHVYHDRRKSRNNPFFDNFSLNSEGDRPVLNKYHSDNILHGNSHPAPQQRTIQRSKTERVNHRSSLIINESCKHGSSHHTQNSRHHHHDKKDRSRRRSKIPKELELDTIDKLDVTGIFFSGGFHHDGPFDAARPQRNRHNNKNAPILAFPKNGSNSRVGRSHTISASSSEVSFSNPLTRKGTISGQFDSKVRTDMIHGRSSVGLGSTTFLDGAPASQNAINEDIKNHIRRNRTLKDNRRKSIGDFLRGDFDFSNVPEPKQEETKNKDTKKGNKFLRRVKSLRTAYRS